MFYGLRPVRPAGVAPDRPGAAVRVADGGHCGHQAYGEPRPVRTLQIAREPDGSRGDGGGERQAAEDALRPLRDLALGERQDERIGKGAARPAPWSRGSVGFVSRRSKPHFRQFRFCELQYVLGVL
jgi:hypothetical protein